MWESAIFRESGMFLGKSLQLWEVFPTSTDSQLDQQELGQELDQNLEQDQHLEQNQEQD